ncbi:MAG TPA: cytochrome c peroxidase [Gemmatimonadales bacterium]|nr:cytochrome c peroxidase [Gemmatimonadales bacterium]
MKLFALPTRPAAGPAVLVWCALALACDADPSGPPTGSGPTVASPNGAVALTVGTAVSYDATQRGTTFGAPDGGLRYRVTFDGASGGLSAEGATIRGTPTAPGVVRATVVATDALGRTASDRFALVAFAPGLGAPALPSAPYAYAGALPPHFATAGAADNTPADNPVTDAGAALGRVLFYDPRLSANDGLSCAGCHLQSLGFSDFPVRSVGFGGAFTRRHSPGLANARFYRPGRFFWDQRAESLEDQALQPIQDPNEMGVSLEDLTAKLQATAYYPALFAAAFGTSEVTSERVARALAQFVRSLVSTGSRYDRAFAGGTTPDFAAVFTPQEAEGEALFRSAGCATCHTTAAQVSDTVHNIGLDALASDSGAGRGAFKAPSLRNVALRPRYMHDGRFTTLEQVIDFFDAGVQANPDLDPRLEAPDGTPRRLGLTPAQKGALAAFLRTLTDSAFVTAPRFANPFPPAAGGPPPGTTVTMQANAFHPATLSVPPGTVVTWTNLDGIGHSATFESGPVGSTPTFVSGSRQLTMPAARGTYPYYCAVHGTLMSGTIEVR